MQGHATGVIRPAACRPESLLNYLLTQYHQQRRLTRGGSEFALVANLPEAVSLGRVGLDSVLEGRFD
jgi:hypothetical protein